MNSAKSCVFLDDELLVETNYQIISHAETCANCRRELAARQALRLKQRAAIADAPETQMSDEFVKSLRAQLRARTWRVGCSAASRETKFKVKE